MAERTAAGAASGHLTARTAEIEVDFRRAEVAEARRRFADHVRIDSHQLDGDRNTSGGEGFEKRLQVFPARAGGGQPQEGCHPTLDQPEAVDGADEGGGHHSLHRAGPDLHQLQHSTLPTRSETFAMP